MGKLWTLIKMQARSMIDTSFMRSKRAFILKAGLALLQFAAVTAAFYVVFFLCVMLSVFSYGEGIPETVVTVLFTLIQLMSIVSCMMGLSKSLYRSGDNVILLILPVSQSVVFLSKLCVYYLFELKRSLSLTLPLFLAYGLINGAVWFYYPWMILCLALVSLLPVALGAVLSIPALYVPKLLSRVSFLKYLIILAAAAGLVVLAFFAVGMIPANINILGRWGSITASLRSFLNTFAKYFAPWHYLNLMMVGGSLEITRRLFSLRTLYVLLVFLGVLAVLLSAAFFTARLLFLKLTAHASETDTRKKKARKNKVRGKHWSILSEDLTRNFRSGKAIWLSFLEFFVPAFLLFALNKIYAAMNTSLSGQTMTAAFNILVLLVTVLSSNVFLATVYSRDGAARNLLKTRPVDFRWLLAARLVMRAVMSTLSILTAVLLFHFVAKAATMRTVGFLFTAVFANLAHILWCAEIDVMHPESKSSGSNTIAATAYSLIISVLFTAVFYLLSNSGATSAFIKLAVIAGGFLILRAHLYFARVKIYFIER